jgi:hypothetical protein
MSTRRHPQRPSVRAARPSDRRRTARDAAREHAAVVTAVPAAGLSPIVDVPGVGRCIPLDRLIERDPRVLQLLDELIESAWT